MKRRVLIFGSTGQLGGDLLSILKANSSWVVHGLSHSSCNVEDPKSVERAIDDWKPDSVVNCTAYNWVDRAEKDPVSAFALNAAAVGTMARICSERKIFFVHFSTDYVFDGELNRPYREEDKPHPINIYGLSKASGEESIRILCPNHCIIRTCGLYGFRSGLLNYNFIEKIMAQAKAGTTLRVRSDSFMNPTYAWELARATAEVVDRQLTGTFHGANQGSCSWFQFAEEIIALGCLKAKMEPLTGNFGSLSTRRPNYSVLDPTAFHKAGVTPLSNWKDALKAYFQRRMTLSPGETDTRIVPIGT